jgi:hypothetical protein
MDDLYSHQLLAESYRLLAEFLTNADKDLNCDNIYSAMLMMMDLAERMAQDSPTDEMEDYDE